MAKRILVPIEDSGDAILPLTASLARGAGATVRLLRVVPIPRALEDSYLRVIASADQVMERLRATAASELAAAAATLEGIPVETVVRFGEPGVEAAVEAEVFDADLVLVSTSRTALGAFFAPRPGDAVARRASTPVLALRTRGGRR